MKLPGRSFRFSVLNIKFFIFIAFFLLSFLTLNFNLLTQVYAATGANQQVNFQGKVVNANGTNVTDGVLDFVIKIYDGPGSSATTLFTESWTSAALWSSTMSTAPASGGTSLVYVTDTNESTIKVGQIITNTTKRESVYVTAIDTATNTITISPTRQAWATTDTVTNKIYVNNGVFRIIVNSLNQDFSGVNFGSDSLYVGLTVGSDSEMKPRVRLTATPYAMSAERLNGSYSSGTDGTNANSFTMTNSASSGSITTNALSLSLVGTNNATGTNVINGLKFENVTAKTNNSFYGLNFGTGFTDILRYNGTQIISGSGVLQSAGLSGTYSNALTLSSTSNSITAGTLTINGDAFTDLTGTNLQISGGVLGTIANPIFSTSVTSPVVIGGTAVSSTLTLRSTSGVGTTDAIIFQVGNNGATEAVRITNGGNVGIGTATPGTTLDVVGTGRFSSTLTANTFSSSGVTITGGSINGTTIGASTPSTGAFTTLSSTGATTIGNNSATVAIDSSDWDISATGAMTGIGAITMDGNFSQTGATIFSTGTGAISLNGDTTIAAGKNLVLASGAGTYTQTFTGTTTTASTLTASALTSGNLLDLSSTSTTATSADLLQGDHTATYTTAQTVSGNLLDLSRALTINAAATTLTVSGAVATISDNCTVTAGTCTHSGSLLDLTQNYTSSTGTALYLKSYGADAGVAFRVDDVSGDTSPFVVMNTGNVGIGTAAPASKLGVVGNLSLGATYGTVAAPTSGLIVEGNVGIGTTAPGAALEIGGSGNVRIGGLTASSGVYTDG